jgi:microcystin-dependent protein
MLVTDYSSYKTLTGFDFNVAEVGKSEIDSAYIDLVESMAAVRLKVSKLNSLEISLNDFLTVEETVLKELYLTRFKDNSEVSFWVGEDTVFDTLTEIDYSNPETDLIAAGLVCMSKNIFDETYKGESFNFFNSVKRVIPIDYTSIKTAASIASSDISIFILFKFGGFAYFINSSSSKLEYSLNFHIKGDFFFDLESKVSADGFLKLSDIESLNLSSLEIGDIILSGNDITDETQLPADGRAISRTTYAELFAKWGTRFGAGNGSTTFNIIDMGGVVPRGAGTNASMQKSNSAYYAGGIIGNKKLDQVINHTHTTTAFLISSGNIPTDGSSFTTWGANGGRVSGNPSVRGGDQTNDASVTLNFKVKVL